ncbi:MAG: hypothetical protein IT320_14920 [Anaerolineae bacterium]|nr:hypothetical protein [Anaerolineae bacterium]
MMSPTEYLATHKYTRAEMERRADRRRLVREALAGYRGNVRVIAPLLAKLGSGMVTFGSSLQQRYGEARLPHATSKPSFTGA